MSRLLVAAVLITISLSLSKECNAEEGKLLFATVLFRHGDRNPYQPYPNDPWRDQQYWPEGFAQLTNTGKQQHYELGTWLRQRYNSLVSERFNSTEMYVRSTDVDRTLMSAMANLAGFYPPQKTDVWNKKIPWQPIPVHTTPEKQDSLLAAKKPCRNYEEQLEKLFKSEEFKLLDEQFKPLYEYLTLHTGEQIKSLEDVEYLYSCLHIEEIHDYSLPEWTRGVYPEKLYPISALSFASRAYLPGLARLKSGPLLKEILENFRNKSLGLLEQNYWVYSAHDTTVANMLNTLGLFKPMGYHNPSFRAAVLFELRQINADFHVQIFYRNTTAEPKALDIPGCGISCPLEKMFKLYEEVLPVDWQAECDQGLSDQQNRIFKLFFILFCVVAVFIAFFHKWNVKQNEKLKICDAKNLNTNRPDIFEKLRNAGTTEASMTSISVKH